MHLYSILNLTGITSSQLLEDNFYPTSVITAYSGKNAKVVTILQFGVGVIAIKCYQIKSNRCF